MNAPTVPTAAFSALRLPLLALLLALAVALGWASLRVNLQQACYAQQWPVLPGCAEVGALELEQQLERLHTRIAANPGDGLAHAELVRYSLLPEAQAAPGGDRLLETAVRLAPQHPHVLQMQVNQALQAQQWPEATRLLVSLVRVHGDAEARRWLAVLVARAGAEPALMGALGEALARDPLWLEPVLRTMPSAELPLAMPLVGRLALAGQLSPALGQFLMRRLKTEGAWLDAHAIWLQLWKKPLGLLFNGDFEQAFIADGFDWAVLDEETYQAGAQVDLVGRSGRGQVLSVLLTGRALRKPVLRQDLLLAPGAYRFAGEYQSDNLRSNEGLSWTVSCARDGRELARSPALQSTGREWKPLGARFQVPADCGLAVQLTLQTHAAYEARTGLRGEMRFDRFTLVQE